MYIPVFEIKDSYILKNKLQYDTSCNSELPYKMMFTDYDLAKKSQTVNGENFSGVTMDEDLNNYSLVHFDYFDESYDIYLDGSIVHEDVFSGTTVLNSSQYQEYYVPDGSLFFSNDELVDIEIYQKYSESGTTFWEHDAYVPNDIWGVTGLTETDLQWIVTGTTVTVGYSSGYTNWYLDHIVPLLEYTVNIVSTGATYIRVQKKIEDYLYNNLLSNYDNLYYKIVSINHCTPSYADLYNKLSRVPKASSFDLSTTSSSITLDPIYDETNVYFRYDSMVITLSGVTSKSYTFETDYLYNKYDLRKFFAQLGIGENAAMYEPYSTTSALLSGYMFGDYYMTFDVPNTYDFTEYTYVEMLTDSGNTYNVIITGVTDFTITVISPLNYIEGDNIAKISNIFQVGPISDVLQKTYENYEQDEYRKHHSHIQKSIYNAYAEIVNTGGDQGVRQLVTGLIFENENKIMVLKIFDPADFIDDRLLYEPIEIVRIGKDKKTSIPISILDFTKGLAADVIDANIYSVYLFDPRIYAELVINANAT